MIYRLISAIHIQYLNCLCATYLYVHTHIHTYMHAYMYVYPHAQTRTDKSIYTCMYMYMYIHTTYSGCLHASAEHSPGRTSLYTHACTCTCTCTCTYNLQRLPARFRGAQSRTDKLAIDGVPLTI